MGFPKVIYWRDFNFSNKYSWCLCWKSLSALISKSSVFSVCFVLLLCCSCSYCFEVSFDITYCNASSLFFWSGFLWLVTLSLWFLANFSSVFSISVKFHWYFDRNCTDFVSISIMSVLSTSEHKTPLHVLFLVLLM